MKTIIRCFVIVLQVCLCVAVHTVHAGHLEDRLRGYVTIDQIDDVREMIDNGANVNWKDANGSTALIVAAQHHDNVDMIKLLIEKGADVNADDKQGETALMMAAYNGYADIVRMLAEKGADLNMKNYQGSTALLRACADRPSADVVRVLIEKGADINIRDNIGQTALGEAMFNANKNEFHYFGRYTADQEKEIAEIIRILRKAGARAQ